MPDRHFAHWPPGLPRHLSLPATNVWCNAEVSARRHPNKPFIVFYGTTLDFSGFKDETECIAGYLQQVCGIRTGDRVVLYMQNSPQWMLAFYGILRANAVVVPLNPMSHGDELAHCLADSGASTAFVPQDLYPRIQPLLRDPACGLRHVVVAAYSDYLGYPTDLPVPEFVASARRPITDPGASVWSDMLARRLAPGPLTAGPDDLCVMPYTSGTTGQPKACMHTHRSVMSTLVGSTLWFGCTQDTIHLSVLPLFHVTGMTGGMNGPLFAGSTVVVLPRWDREAAAACIERYRVSSWQAISTMVIDFLANPRLGGHELGSLSCIRGGGAPMPETVAASLKRLTGLDYVEGYGLSETMAATHINPPRRPKPRCLGIPVFEVDARVIDPVSLAELPAGETGEIVVSGPQLMSGYWKQEQASLAAFIEIDGRRFLRTGDLGHVDDEGYFFLVDRLKRMINAAGFKVWPAEVESLMHTHPAIQEVCVIAARDARRGETVKALVVLKETLAGRITEADIVAWARARLAAYKSPRIVEFVPALPKSATGKVQWRRLQDIEDGRPLRKDG